MLKQLVRFGMVGLAGTACQYALLVAMVEGIGMRAVEASALGAIAGALVNYALNRVVDTFASDRPHHEALPRFMLVAVTGLAVNSIVMATLMYAGIHYLAAQVAATAVVFLFNFVANRLWTFRILEH